MAASEEITLTSEPETPQLTPQEVHCVQRIRERALRQPTPVPSRRIYRWSLVAAATATAVALIGFILSLL